MHLGFFKTLTMYSILQTFVYGGRLYYQVDPHAQARLVDANTASNQNILQGVPPALIEGKIKVKVGSRSNPG